MIIIVILTTIKCKQSKSDNTRVDDFTFMKPFQGEKVNINFSLIDSTLIKDIEKQISYELCDNPLFIGEITHNSKKIEFQARVFGLGFCGAVGSISVGYNKIEVNINKYNEVLISYKQFVPKGQKIDIKIAKETDVMPFKIENKPFYYEINWDKTLEPKIIESRIYEVLNAIKIYSNKISKRKFDKNVDELNADELVYLKKEYIGIIAFRQNDLIRIVE